MNKKLDFFIIIILGLFILTIIYWFNLNQKDFFLNFQFLYLLPLILACIFLKTKGVFFLSLIIYLIDFSFIEKFEIEELEILKFVKQITCYIFLNLIFAFVLEKKTKTNSSLKKEVLYLETLTKNTTSELYETKRNLKNFTDLTKEYKEKHAKITDLLERLADISRELNSTLDWAKILEIIINMVVKIIGAKKCSLFLKEEKSNQLKLVKNHGWEDSEKDSQFTIEVGEGIIGYVAQYAKDKTILTLSLEDVRKDYTLFDLQKNNKIETVLCAPLIYQNEVKGIINIEEMDNYTYEKRRLLFILSTFAAIALENAKLFKFTEDLANFDGLTKVYTRRIFDEYIEIEFKKTKKHNSYLSLFLIDIDHFKNFNDTYGHQIGDFVLQEIANVLKKNLRDSDLTARYGGEEFAAILSGTDIEGARVVAERIRKKVEETLFTFNGYQLKITVSIGVATYSPEDMNEKELICRADQALYQAKQNGRNMVCVSK